MLILKCFKSDYFNVKSKLTEQTDGYVYASEASLQNFVALLKVTEEDKDGIRHVGLITDFTFNLMTDGWTDGSIGCRSLRIDKTGDIVQQYRPFLGSVNRFENAQAYTAMFESITDIGRILEVHIPKFAVHVLGADGHLGCKKAVEDCFPRINADGSQTKRTSCWPHIKRNSLANNRDKFRDIKKLKEFNDDLTELHLARSNLQYETLAPLMSMHWVGRGEPEVANYFNDHLIGENFHVTASLIPGTNPCQQTIENSHKVQKLERDSGKLSLGMYTKKGLPEKLQSQARSLANKPILLKPPPTTMPNRALLCAAVELLYQDEDFTNYVVMKNCTVKDSTGVTHNFYDCTVINSSVFLIQSDVKNTVTKKAAKQFISSLVGKVSKNSTFEEAKKLCLSMHMVHKLASGELRCTCKGFWSKAQCSHVTAVLHLHGKIDLEEEMRLVSRPKATGRPQKYTPVGFQSHDNADASRAPLPFQPSSLVGTRIVVEHDNGRKYHGIVQGPRDTGERYVWGVVYPHQYEDEDAEEDDDEMDYASIMRGARLRATYDLERKRKGRIHYADDK